MILSPYMKKVEIFVGYKGFYTCGNEKVSITVEENGIKAIIDTRSGRPNETGELKKYFKPMSCLEEARIYAQNEFLELPSFQLEEIGFVELKIIEA